MKILFVSFFFLVSLTHESLAESEISKAVIDGVTLKSSKEGAVRSYQGSIERNFPFPIEIIKASITNFSDRCNNEHRQMRKHTAQEYNCKHHNDHFIETFVIKDIKPQESFKEFNETYVLGRRAYNRSLLSYHELVQIKEEKNNQKLKSIIIQLKMLSDSDVQKIINPQFKNESAFDESASTFTLTLISENETKLKYTYKASTDHWLLNKEVSVQQVFASVSKSLNTLFKSVQDEAMYLKSLEQKKE